MDNSDQQVTSGPTGQTQNGQHQMLDNQTLLVHQNVFKLLIQSLINLELILHLILVIEEQPSTLKHKETTNQKEQIKV
jgi:hypothetical protein